MNMDDKYLSLDDEDFEWADDYNRDEVSTVLDLIKDKGLSPNYFNTMEWVNNCQKRIINPSTPLLTEELAIKHSVISFDKTKDFETNKKQIGLFELNQLEKIWNSIYKDVARPINYDDFYREKHAINRFLHDISYGSYSSPEILLMIAKCFDLYFLAQGELTLEEVFFGKTQKRSGNYARRKARDDNFTEFHYRVIREKAVLNSLGQSFNLEEFTFKMLKSYQESEMDSPIGSYTEENIESFIVAYYRWKKRYIIKQKSILDIEEIKSDAIAALRCLGYQESDSEKAVLKIFDGKLTTEENIKKALMILINNK